MRALDGNMMLMRVFVSENDSHNGKPLYTELVEMLRREGIAGATVLRGVMGYGANSVLHAGDPFRLGQGMPLCIEVVDSEEHLNRILPKLDAMVIEGLMTMERVRVIKYAPF
jgi:PII-like signaling protein